MFALAGDSFLRQSAPGYAVVLWVVAAIIFFSLKMANQWEKYVVLRAGRLQAVKGPGLFAIIPILDSHRGGDRSSASRPPPSMRNRR